MDMIRPPFHPIEFHPYNCLPWQQNHNHASETMIPHLANLKHQYGRINHGQNTPGKLDDILTTQKKVYRCFHCHYSSDRKNNLSRHVTTMHDHTPKRLDCCGILFTNKFRFREHVTQFHKNGYMCPICGRNFCRKALLNRHLVNHDSNYTRNYKDSWQCPNVRTKEKTFQPEMRDTIEYTTKFSGKVNISDMEICSNRKETNNDRVYDISILSSTVNEGVVAQACTRKCISPYKCSNCDCKFSDQLTFEGHFCKDSVKLSSADVCLLFLPFHRLLSLKGL